MTRRIARARRLGRCSLVALLLIPLSGSYVTGLAAEILIFAIFAMSLDLLIGYTGLLSFGHAAFFGVAAYTAVILGVHLGWSGWVGFVAGIAMSAPRRARDRLLLDPRVAASRS